MREAIRVTCMLVIAAAIFAAALAWANDRPTVETWIWRVVSTGVGLVAFVVFLVVHFQRDAVPDYLFERVGETFFECNGFCFMPKLIAHQGACLLEVYFQNQQDAPSHASIALRPAENFFRWAAHLDAIRLEIPCPPGAFGVARLPLAVLRQFQATHQSFVVGASVVYPEGKGRTIRFRDGTVVRNKAQLSNSAGSLLTAGGVLAGPQGHISPTSLTLMVPLNVGDNVPADSAPKIITLWKLGDPPLAAT